jgi:hypothetical protein
MNPPTQREIARVVKLLDEHRVVGGRKGAPGVKRADRGRLRIRTRGRSAATTPVSPAQSYLRVDRC